MNSDKPYKSDGCGKCPTCAIVKVLNAVEVLERADVQEVCKWLVLSIQNSHRMDKTPFTDPAYAIGLLQGIHLATEALNVPVINQRDTGLLQGAIMNAIKVNNAGPLAQAILASIIQEAKKENGAEGPTVH